MDDATRGSIWDELPSESLPGALQDTALDQSYSLQTLRRIIVGPAGHNPRPDEPPIVSAVSTFSTVQEVPSMKDGLSNGAPPHGDATESGGDSNFWTFPGPFTNNV
ncbi:hypothetical protein IFR05_015414 [Cadophora sp. M221]|nr:hypothetical protein IFR05_015414 [Cadophora sp. M221]